MFSGFGVIIVKTVPALNTFSQGEKNFLLMLAERTNIFKDKTDSSPFILGSILIFYLKETFQLPLYRRLPNEYINASKMMLSF